MAILVYLESCIKQEPVLNKQGNKIFGEKHTHNFSAGNRTNFLPEI